MIHRGPDSTGTWNDSSAGLAATRLAVIDLDKRSNQPLHRGPWHLVFNGEIYNYRELRDELRRAGHRFETEGDGEVLLHAWAEWQEAALNRLNGMFALAVWNDERRELTCARDPFGEKPLFWADGPSGFAFASEIRALQEARPDLTRPNGEAIRVFLGSGVMPRVHETFFEGVRQLPGAHLLRVRANGVEIHEYWRAQRVATPSDFASAAEELRGRLSESIRLRLRSDVPVGTSLSGGIDSSVVACLAARNTGEHRRHAFTARFPGFERDEWSYARAAADAAGVIEHHSVEPTAADLLDDLERVVLTQEEPFGSASIYAQWRVMQCARTNGVTVLLDGQGADELFGGYAGTRGWAVLSSGGHAVIRGLGSGDERRDTLRACVSGGRLLPVVTRLNWRRGTSPYVVDAVRHEAAAVVAPDVKIAGLRTPLARELLRQSFHTSMPALLRYADRNSMAHSREVRLPFLDRNVAEFALSLPATFLYRDGYTKAVLREAVRDVVPAELLARRDKVGFDTPQERWFAEPAFVRRVCEVLLDARAQSRGIYSSDVIEADALSGRWRAPNSIWRALNLEIWLNAFETNARLAI
jgi:asparagine synthase (glutamine-hydrolysing)